MLFKRMHRFLAQDSSLGRRRDCTRYKYRFIRKYASRVHERYGEKISIR